VARPAVFLDRDGTIIEDTHYISDPDLVTLLPGAVEGMRAMSEKGYLLFVISNQSGVGQGIISQHQFLEVHRRVFELLKAEKVTVAGFFYCFHHPLEGCACRKPGAALIPREHKGVVLDWPGSYTVGDKPCDVELATAIGSKGFLVLTGKGEQSLAKLGQPCTFKVCANLPEVALQLPAVPQTV
jgi:histidinol-phosphate phosphatase family protein